MSPMKKLFPHLPSSSSRLEKLNSPFSTRLYSNNIAHISFFSPQILLLSARKLIASLPRTVSDTRYPFNGRDKLQPSKLALVCRISSYQKDQHIFRFFFFFFPFFRTIVCQDIFPRSIIFITTLLTRRRKPRIIYLNV